VGVAGELTCSANWHIMYAPKLRARSRHASALSRSCPAAPELFISHSNSPIAAMSAVLVPSSAIFEQ